MKSDLKDRIYDYLKGLPSGAAPGGIAAVVLKLRGGPKEVSERVVGAALGEDPRFLRSPDGRWRLAPAGTSPPVEQVDFLVVVLGVSPRPSRIAEIGAVKMTGGRVLGGFFRTIELEQGMRAEEGPGETGQWAGAGQALGDLAAFAADAIWVADDLPSTLALLNWEARRSGAPGPPAGGLSLRRLGRRLFPGEKVRSCYDLLAGLGLPLHERGRADREAQALGAVLWAMLERCPTGGRLTLDVLLALQEQDLEEVDFGGYGFDREVLRRLPERPGVYLMLDRKGELLYVGKAKCLRDRVGSYFARTSKRSERMGRFMERLYDIRAEVVGSELEALLLEGRLIRLHRPEFNVQVGVHERPPAGPDRDEVFVLPSGREGCVELFMVRTGTGLRQVRARQDLSDIDEVAAALEGFYEGDSEGSGDERLDAEVARSWLAVHGDDVSRLDVLGVRGLSAGLRLLKEYIAGCGPTWERVTYV